MTTSYFNILMNYLEQMQFEVTAAAETTLQDAVEKAREMSASGDFSKLVFVSAGEGKLRTAEGQEALKMGDGALILPGTAYELEPLAEGKIVFKWCHIRAKYRDQDVYKKMGLPLVVKFRSAEASGLFDKIICSLPQEGIASRLRVKGAALELISLCLESLPDREKRLTEVPATQEMEKIEAVLQYIDEHLMDNLTVEELARLVYLHPNYFIVFFKSMLGCSPIQYVNNRRMETARMLLLDLKYSVSDVANRIGMKIYYFSRMFKAHTGLTPSRYRKLAAERQGAVPIEAALQAAAGSEDEDDEAALREEAALAKKGNTE